MRTRGCAGRRTKDNGVELVGALVHVGQQDPAGLECGEELRLPGLSQGGQEDVAALGDTLLQHRRVVRHRVHLLHVHVQTSAIATSTVVASSKKYYILYLIRPDGNHRALLM